MSYKTTKKDFKLFVKTFIKTSDKLGLTGWEFNFKHGETDEGSVAEVSFFRGARIASVYYAAVLHKKPSKKNIKGIAIHEVLHVFFRPIVEKARSMYSYEHLEPIEHELLHTIQGLLE